ncbi:MAG TPA: hypothetical protein EYP82_01940 [Hydrogenothermaceae bacterium]|nr:hypothetical protein [Hydrogenothermaceae bacterium]
MKQKAFLFFIFTLLFSFFIYAQDNTQNNACIKIVKLLTPKASKIQFRISAYAKLQKDIQGQSQLEAPVNTGIRIDIPIYDTREKLVWDDVKASEAVWLLYKGRVDFYTIVRAFSLGLLGVKRNRRLVPTRWAITAVDSAIATKLLEIIKFENKVVDYIEVYTASYIGNKFIIILFPGPYRLEMVEIWHPSTIWTQNAGQPVLHWVREDKPNRFTEIDGGMMAARLSILEHLARRKRQASVLIVREITPDYYAPVGNWHIRLTTAHALSQPMLKSNNLKEAIELLGTSLKDKNLLSTIIERSRIFDRLYNQKRLDHYF